MLSYVVVAGVGVAAGAAFHAYIYPRLMAAFKALEGV